MNVTKLTLIQNDEWSLTNPIFTTRKGGKIKVLGWTSKVGWNKKYVVKCNLCSLDKELNGQGIYFAVKFDLVSGKVPCSCSISRRWTEDQYKVLLKRKLGKKGYDFLGWNGCFKNAFTKIIAKCALHGIWNSTNINSALKGVGCPKCSGHNQKEAYVNVVFDGETPVAIKFGITSDTKARLKGQNRLNLFQMQNLCVFKFDSVDACRQAEKRCLEELGCGILSSRELVDGWSETTDIVNLERILEIFKSEGKRID